MTLPSKPVLFRLGIAALVLLVAANLALHSSALQNRLARGLSRKLGAEVQIGRMKPRLFGQTVLKNVTASGFRGGSLSIREVRARPSWSSVLTGKFAFSDLQIEDVRFVRTESRPAGLRTPGAQTSETPAQHGSAKPLLPLLKMLGNFAVTNAAVDMFDPDGRIRLQLEGIHLRFEASASQPGNFRVERGCCLDFLRFQNLQGALQVDSDRLLLSDLTAECGGGRLLAHGSVGLSRESTFHLDAQAASIDLSRMNPDQATASLTGNAEGHLTCSGDLHNPASWAGSGGASLTEGSFAGLELLQFLGQIFQISELANLKVKRATAKFRIAEGRVSLEPLEMDCGEFLISSSGSVDFERNLLLENKFSLPERLTQGKALSLFANRMGAPDASGRRVLPFQISGTLDKPKTNLLEKVAVENIGAVVGGVLEQFLGGVLKPRKPAKNPDGTAEEPKPENR